MILDLILTSFGISPGQFFAVNELKALFPHKSRPMMSSLRKGKGFRASVASLHCVCPGKRMFYSGHGRRDKMMYDSFDQLLEWRGCQGILQASRVYATHILERAT